MDAKELEAFRRELHADSPGCVLLGVLLVAALILGGAVLFFTTKLF